MAAAELGDWRARIDAVDRLLLDLLNRRMEYALEIGRIKRQRGWAVRDLEREQDVLRRLQLHSRGPLSDAAIGRIFDGILEEARGLESEPGEQGDEDGSGPSGGGEGRSLGESS